MLSKNNLSASNALGQNPSSSFLDDLAQLETAIEMPYLKAELDKFKQIRSKAARDDVVQLQIFGSPSQPAISNPNKVGMT